MKATYNLTTMVGASTRDLEVSDAVDQGLSPHTSQLVIVGLKEAADKELARRIENSPYKAVSGVTYTVRLEAQCKVTSVEAPFDELPEWMADLHTITVDDGAEAEELF